MKSGFLQQFRQMGFKVLEKSLHGTGQNSSLWELNNGMGKWETGSETQVK